jgi:hypothetical protein
VAVLLLALSGKALADSLPVAATLQAGAAVIGHVISDTGSVVNATLQASSAAIGHVIVDSGTIALSAGAATIGSIANTTFAVTQATGSNLHAVLDAGAAIIGKFGIDQTTPGTTNGVVVNSGTTTVTQATGTNLHSVLDAGAAVIGHVINDAGAALIGKVGIDQTTPGGTNLVNAKSCDAATPTQCAAVSAGGGLRTQPFLDGSGLSIQALACGSSVAVNISTAATTAVVPLVAAKLVYVCGYSLYVVSGTLPSFQFVYGTGAACVTGQTALTGTYGGIAGAIGELFQSGSGLGTIFRVPASNGLCLISGGTTPNIQGVVSFSQF